MAHAAGGKIAKAYGAFIQEVHEGIGEYQQKYNCETPQMLGELAENYIRHSQYSGEHNIVDGEGARDWFKLMMRQDIDFHIREVVNNLIGGNANGWQDFVEASEACQQLRDMMHLRTFGKCPKLYDTHRSLYDDPARAPIPNFFQSERNPEQTVNHILRTTTMPLHMLVNPQFWDKEDDKLLHSPEFTQRIPRIPITGNVEANMYLLCAAEKLGVTIPPAYRQLIEDENKEPHSPRELSATHQQRIDAALRDFSGVPNSSPDIAAAFAKRALMSFLGKRLMETGITPDDAAAITGAFLESQAQPVPPPQPEPAPAPAQIIHEQAMPQHDLSAKPIAEALAAGNTDRSWSDRSGDTGNAEIAR